VKHTKTIFVVSSLTNVSNAIAISVSMSVLCPSIQVSQKPRPNFTRISAHIAYHSGLFLY